MKRALALALVLTAGCSRLNPIAPVCTNCPGNPCEDAGSCYSGHCVDGVCCDSACTGACDRCDLADTLGTCSPALAGQSGAPACVPYVCDGAGNGCPMSCSADTVCAAGHYCDGATCVPALTLGSACVRDRLCVSGHCTDGVCCDSACAGGCDRCDLAGTVGTCTPAPLGATGSPSCAPYTCNGAGIGCPTNCSADGECTDAGFCTNTGACVVDLQNGNPCSRGGQCQSGFCADGVCCESACTEACQTCSRLVPGTCTIAPPGSAGRPACAPFTCNGASTVCGTSCSGDAGCSGGFACSGTACLVDGDGDGVADADDCAPADATRSRLRTCYRDSDTDGVIAAVGTSTCSGGACPVGFTADAGTDCDDGSASTFQLLNCAFGPDVDNDGYHLGALTPACSGLGCPDGGSSLQDCDDENANAKPGQRAFFDVPRDGGSFDYDCNGAETKNPGWDCLTNYTSTSVCTGVALTGARGFLTTVPACGAAGTWRSCASWEDGTCSSITWWYGGCGFGCVAVDGGTSYSVEQLNRLMDCR